MRFVYSDFDDTEELEELEELEVYERSNGFGPQFRAESGGGSGSKAEQHATHWVEVWRFLAFL